jgi:uncharacterized membrane-anchored protein
LDKTVQQQQLDPNAGARGIGAQPAQRALYAARKVPEIILLFWVAKLLTTALGEATSDYLVYSYDKYRAVILGFVCFVIALALQLLVRRYIAWVYWLAVLMVAVFGTMAADVTHIVLNVPYWLSTICFAVALAIIFALWYATEKTLSIHSIYTLRRELFYWATVMATFALGTAAGDLLAYSFNLGFFVAGLLFAVLFALPGLAYRLVGLNAIAAFWFAYILTRPLGASFADWFGKSPDVKGLGLGDGPVSLVLFVLLVVVVGYLQITRKDIKGAATGSRR